MQSQSNMDKKSLLHTDLEHIHISGTLPEETRKDTPQDKGKLYHIPLKLKPKCRYLLISQNQLVHYRLFNNLYLVSRPKVQRLVRNGGFFFTSKQLFSFNFSVALIHCVCNLK